MTRDEKYLAMLEKIPGRLYDGFYPEVTYVLEFKGLPSFYHYYHYWLLNDGTALKWSTRNDVWYEIASQRVKRALFMRAWPEWVPSGEENKAGASFYVPSVRRPNIRYLSMTPGSGQMETVVWRVFDV